MSYDFMMLKPTRPLQSPDEVCAEVLRLQAPEATVRALTDLYPETAWQHTPEHGWFGTLNAADGWYEFRIGPNADHVWTIHTSHGAGERALIGAICRALDLAAFDGQANRLIPARDGP